VVVAGGGRQDGSCWLEPRARKTATGCEQRGRVHEAAQIKSHRDVDGTDDRDDHTRPDESQHCAG